MEGFYYKGGYGIYVLRHLKEWMAWDIDKWFQFISYTIKEPNINFTAPGF